MRYAYDFICLWFYHVIISYSNNPPQSIGKICLSGWYKKLFLKIILLYQKIMLSNSLFYLMN